MEFWDFILTFLAGAGLASVLILVEKACYVFNWIKYRHVIKAYSILTARTMSVQADLKQATYQKTIVFIMELARLRKWDVLEVILSDTIKTISGQPELYFYFGEEEVNKWIKIYKENDEKKRKFINEFKKENELGSA